MFLLKKSEETPKQGKRPSKNTPSKNGVSVSPKELDTSVAKVYLLLHFSVHSRIMQCGILTGPQGIRTV